MMRTATPAGLPIFRSEGQARLLSRIFLSFDRDAPIAKIARELNLDPGGVAREATRLEQAGLIESVRIGRQRHLRPNTSSPFFEPLCDLLARAYGPPQMIAAALARIPGIDRALIYGSWAARYHGRLGPPPNDIDVLVIGKPERRALARAVRKLSSDMGLEVDPHLVSNEDFEQERTGFLREVKHGPHVKLDMGAAK